MDWVYWILLGLLIAGGAVLGQSAHDRKWKLAVPAAVWCAAFLTLIVLHAG